MTNQSNSSFRKIIARWMALILPVIVVLCIFVFIEIIANNHSWTWDVTPGKIYTPSEQAIKILKSLKDDVTFTTFYKYGDYQGLFGLYQQMQTYSKHFKYQLIDFDKNPAEARLYNVAKYGDTVIQYKGKRLVFTYPTEGKIVNTIIKLTTTKPKVIYFVRGHGEKETEKEYSELKESLETEAWVVKDLWLMQEKTVPVDATLLVIAGPEKDFLEHELKLLSEYATKEGKVVFLLEPFTKIPRLITFLNNYHLKLADDVIVDKANKLSGGEFMDPLITMYSAHEITRSMKAASILSSARSIGVKTTQDKGVDIQPLALTSQLSWTKAAGDLKAGESDFKEGVDMNGPIPIAVLVEIAGKEKKKEGKDNKDKKERKSIIICFGDSDFISNRFLDMLGNKDLFLNTLSWAVWEGDLISIRPKKYELSYHHMSERESHWCLYIPVFILPPVFLAIGIIVFLYRRKHG